MLMQSRGKGSSRNSCVSIFSSKIRCGDCVSWYGSKVWHSNDKYRKVIWQCNHKFDGGENARVAQNQGEYAKRYVALVERFETAKARQEDVRFTFKNGMEVPVKIE